MDFNNKNTIAEQLLDVIDQGKFPGARVNLREYIEANELGLFLEEMCTFVNEEDIPISIEWLNSMQSLCKNLRIREIYWNDLEKLIPKP